MLGICRIISFSYEGKAHKIKVNFVTSSFQNPPLYTVAALLKLIATVSGDYHILIITVLFVYIIQHCFICRSSDSALSEDARIEPKTVATLALTARRSNHSSIKASCYPPNFLLYVG